MVAGSSPASLQGNIKQMATLTDEEIIKDYERFVRHEAMRANTSQSRIGSLIVEYINK